MYCMVLIYLHIFALYSNGYKTVLKNKKMIPTSLILTAGLAFLLTGQPTTGGITRIKEKPVKTNSGVSINVHIGTNRTINNVESNSPKTNKTKPEVSVKAKDEELISEKTIELEDWMKSPKEWNNNNEF